MATFQVKLSKTEVVSAVLPMHEYWLPLSNIDLLLPPVDVAIFFCYEKPPPWSSASPFDVLKKSLAQTLVAYYVFAGEMVRNAAGDPEILCNNRGVDFVEAYADVELRDLNLYNPDESIQGKLVPDRKKGVLAVQATKLSCGGVVVGCTFDHRVGDAYSANMFLVSWAEMAQSKPLSTLPSFRRSLVSPRRPLILDPSIDDTHVSLSDFPKPPPGKQSNGGCGSTPPPPAPARLISRIYSVEAEQIRQLQALANKGNDSPNSQRTKFEAFSAFLWKLISSGTNAGDNYCSLGMILEGRARIMDGDEGRSEITKYFGNLCTVTYGKKRNKELKEMPLSSIANEIHNFIGEGASREHFLGLIDYVEVHRPKPIFCRIYLSKVSKEEPAFLVSSGQRFPVRKIDFGWGVPVFGSYHFAWGAQAGYVMPMPSPSGNGDWIVYMRLYKDQIELIENKAAHVLKPFHLN